MHIVLHGVKKVYPLGKATVPALNGVDFHVKPRDFITVAGPSGSGKTTLLNLLGCLDTASEGSVLLDGVDVKALSLTQRAHLRNEKIGFIFQSFNLVPVLNVYENVELPARIGRRPRSARVLRDWIMHLIAAVGLEDRIRHRPEELSGGQRQRVAIARALVNRPQLVLADEPTANLDSDTAMQTLALMRSLNEEERTAFVFSTHDQDIIDHCHTVVRMKDGRLV
jgi:putative ABC transport system ATP-binding protein